MMTAENNKTGLGALGFKKVEESYDDEIITEATKLYLSGEITELQRDILDLWSMYPEMTGPEVAYEVGTVDSWAYSTKDEYGHIYGLQS